jgi:hypothetical protein
MIRYAEMNVAGSKSLSSVLVPSFDLHALAHKPGASCANPQNHWRHSQIAEFPLCRLPVSSGSLAYRDYSAALGRAMGQINETSLSCYMKSIGHPIDLTMYTTTDSGKYFSTFGLYDG